jgi:hypothetical protein
MTKGEFDRVRADVRSRYAVHWSDVAGAANLRAERKQSGRTTGINSDTPDIAAASEW